MGEVVQMENIQWVPIVGLWERSGNNIYFKGDTIKDQAGQPDTGPFAGNYISDQNFTEGKVSLRAKFSNITDASACAIIFNYNIKNRSFNSAGIIRGPSVFGVNGFSTSGWDFKAFSGNRSFLKPDKDYNIELYVKGSNVLLKVNNVPITEVDVPSITGPVGIFCLGDIGTEVIISDFTIEYEQPFVFVVMEYKSPYFDIYSDVIRSVCADFKIEARIAFNAAGPGLILSDIIRDIRQSKFIIADITPDNPNVFYEVGYSHGLNKPTILISDTSRDKLPFDVSSFRTLFYENSIGGKARLEEGLKKHIATIVNDP